MRKFKVFFLVVVGILFGGGVFGSGITLEASTFTPDPGTTVSLFVRGAPVGATFRWDLDGDGIFEHTTAEPQVTLSVSEGMKLVRVEVARDGKTLAQSALALVSDRRLGAARLVLSEGTSYLVTITVGGKTTLIAPGFVEDIPAGFAVEVVADGGAFWRRAEKLEVVWPVILDPGQTLTFTYRLSPPAGATFQFAGMVSAYVEGRRVEIPIAGVIHP
ncbi:hypothetical protein H5T56_02335 [Candidatus Bipolaricaulota bacterium]|nr:hypothetical protein [Candidatus Bipolaricaulota bacterium]